MRSAKALSRLAVAGALTALVAGCGSSGAGTSSLKPNGGSGASSIQALLAGSVDKVTQAKNATIHMDLTGSVGGQDLNVSGDGIADFAAKKFELTMNLPSSAGISGTLEERAIGQKFYLKLPAAEASLTGGKQWIEFDASDLGASSSTGLNFTGEDPTRLLATLRGVSSSVTKVGTTEVRGVQTTHYRADVDLAKAVKASGADASSLQDFTKSLRSATIPEDVYLDSNGLPRRFAVTLNTSALLPSDAPSAEASAAASAFTVTIDFYNYGTTDTSGITAPPADQIGDLSSVLGGLGNGLTGSGSGGTGSG